MPPVFSISLQWKRTKCNKVCLCRLSMTQTYLLEYFIDDKIMERKCVRMMKKVGRVPKRI